MGELIDKAKGKAKQVEGSITGDRGRQVEGLADELKGKAKGTVEDIKSGIKRTLDNDDDDNINRTDDDGRQAPADRR